MEDDVVQSRCDAIIQQLLYGDKQRSLQQKHQRLLDNVAETLRQYAMLMYRLCRAKQENLARNQTEDAAYCVLAAVSTCQPTLWTVLITWSRALRPRQPELRFSAPVPMIVRLKDVEQFIARTVYLQPATITEGTSSATKGSRSPRDLVTLCGVSMKRQSEKKRSGSKDAMEEGEKKEEEGSQTAMLGQDLASKLALTYFHLNTPNLKKLHMVVAAYEKDVGNVELIKKMEEADAAGSTTLCNPWSSIPLGDTRGKRGRSGSGGVAPSGEGDDDDVDSSSIGLPLTSSWGAAAAGGGGGLCSGSALATHQCLFSNSLNLNTLADKIDAARVTLFHARLQGCLRNPLLYSPLACMKFAKTMLGVVEDQAYFSRPQTASIFLRQNALGDTATSLYSPAHFLHPSRARPQSLHPLPLQLATSQQLWTRLLVAGLWLQMVSTTVDGPGESGVLCYCLSVVKAAQHEKCCIICDTLVRKKPTLRISALVHEAAENLDSSIGEMRSWTALKEAFHTATSTSAPCAPTEGDHGGGRNSPWCDELLKCLTTRVELMARVCAEKKDTLCSDFGEANRNATSTRQSGGAPLSAPFISSPTLRQLVMELCDSFPLAACRAALIGGRDNEAVLSHLLQQEHQQHDREEGGGFRCPPAAAGASMGARVVEELLDSVPCIPPLREVDAVLECAACFLLFHQDCVCPVQRDPAGGFFLCHTCRLARPPSLQLALHA